MHFFSGFVNNVSYSHKTKRVKKKKKQQQQQKSARSMMCFCDNLSTFPVLLASTYNTFEINRNVYLCNTALMNVFYILFIGNVEL